MIETSDSFVEFNLKFEKDYKTSLFDFSYFLAIALNEKYLLQHYFGISKKEWERLNKLFEKTLSTIKDHQSFKDLRMLIEERIETIENMLAKIYTYQGRLLGERSKLVLLWTHILIRLKKIVKTVKNPRFEEGKKIIKFPMEREEIDWNDYYDLLRWFYGRLKNCSYSSYIKASITPSPEIRKKEIRHDKSLWQKNYSNYRMKVSDEIWIFRTVQKFFKKKNEELPISFGKKDRTPMEGYPKILVKFNKDSIEIGELRKKGIMLKKVRFIGRQKVSSEEFKKDVKIKSPTIIFPDGEEFTITDYTPPGDFSSQLSEQYWNEFTDAFIKEFM